MYRLQRRELEEKLAVVTAPVDGNVVGDDTGVPDPCERRWGVQGGAWTQTKIRTFLSSRFFVSGYLVSGVLLLSSRLGRLPRGRPRMHCSRRIPPGRTPCRRRPVPQVACRRLLITCPRRCHRVLLGDPPVMTDSCGGQSSSWSARLGMLVLVFSVLQRPGVV